LLFEYELTFNSINLFILYREDRETELILKLHDFEMRDDPNQRIISHFKKGIETTRKRIDIAKARYKALVKEYDALVSMKVGEEREESRDSKIGSKEQFVVDIDDNESNTNYLQVLDSSSDDDIGEDESAGSDFGIELSFDASSSKLSKVLNKSQSDEETQVSSDL
jgi:hypothetical protein